MNSELYEGFKSRVGASAPANNAAVSEAGYQPKSYDDIVKTMGHLTKKMGDLIGTGAAQGPDVDPADAEMNFQKELADYCRQFVKMYDLASKYSIEGPAMFKTESAQNTAEAGDYGMADGSRIVDGMLWRRKDVAGSDIVAVTHGQAEGDFWIAEHPGLQNDDTGYHRIVVFDGGMGVGDVVMTVRDETGTVTGNPEFKSLDAAFAHGKNLVSQWQADGTVPDGADVQVENDALRARMAAALDETEQVANEWVPDDSTMHAYDNMKKQRKRGRDQYSSSFNYTGDWGIYEDAARRIASS